MLLDEKANGKRGEEAMKEPRKIPEIWRFITKLAITFAEDKFPSTTRKEDLEAVIRAVNDPENEIPRELNMLIGSLERAAVRLQKYAQRLSAREKRHHGRDIDVETRALSIDVETRARSAK
jgi:hypothetical protein